MTATEPAAPPQAFQVIEPAPGWSLPTSVAFRFFSLYFGIYVVGTQMLAGLMGVSDDTFPVIGTIGPLRRMVEWTASHLFAVAQPLVITGSGSGDKMFDWVQAFCFFVLAVAGTAAWSAVRRRRSDVAIHKWFRLFLRFSLGSTLVTYGAVKVIPMQMGPPTLTRLLEPFGHFSPMGVLWASIGASLPYEIFTGCAELTAGILLFIPRTATLGALVSLACTIQIFTLNMTYDVPVKLFSFHLILMSFFLLAPDARRLLNLLVLDRPADRSNLPPLGRTARAIRIGAIAQVIFGVYLVGMSFNSSAKAWTEWGGGAPKSPLYGIWNVAWMSIDGAERAPLVTDNDRWRRVIFERPTQIAFQRMDDTFARLSSTTDMEKTSVTLAKSDDPKWSAMFSFQQPAPDRMILDGEMDGKKIQLRLELFPRENFLLVNRGFSWIQEHPFNR